jgi:hypothetical protein
MGKDCKRKTRNLVGNPEIKRPLDRPGIGERIILKWITSKHCGMACTEFI